MPPAAAIPGGRAADGRTPPGVEPRWPLPCALWPPDAANAAPGVGAAVGLGGADGPHARGIVVGADGAIKRSPAPPLFPALPLGAGPGAGPWAFGAPAPGGRAENGAPPWGSELTAAGFHRGGIPSEGVLEIWENSGKLSPGSAPGSCPGSKMTGEQQNTGGPPSVILSTDDCHAARIFFFSSGGYERVSAGAAQDAWRWPHSGRHRNPSNLPRTPPGGLSKRQTWADLSAPTAHALTVTERSPSCFRARLYMGSSE